MNKNLTPFIPKEDRLMKYHDVVFSDFIACLFADKKDKTVSKKEDKKTIEEDPPLFI